MTATDELRRLLDERGVEHFDGCESTLWGYEQTSESTGTYRYSADEISGGFVNVWLYRLTPEQAVEATLGRGTCRLEPYAKEICGELCHTFKCSVCKSAVATPHADYYIPSQFFKYCPFCGLEVVAQ